MSSNSAKNPAVLSIRRRLRRWFWHFVVRQLMLLCKIALVIAGWIGRRRRPIGDSGCEIMLTGRFDSENWILNHLGPLSASKGCSHLWMVSTNPVPEMDKVTTIYPSKLLMKFVGMTPARLLTFVWAVIRKRPHFAGGFHLLFNGIFAAIAGHLAGARSMYFCVGGPAEIRGGGIYAENNLCGKMETADTVVEKGFLRYVSEFDVVITMGTGAINYFQNEGIETDFYVVSGGVNSKKFQPCTDNSSIDIILTGRIAEIKRIDIFLRAVKHVVEKLPNVKAVIVGDGELRSELQQLAVELGIVGYVNFVGHQDDVENWLQKAKVFVLTSDSEGLALSMMEAMMSGLPAVVSDVGDLGDIVEDGVNGFLVPRRCPELFADRLVELLMDDQKLKEYSQAARISALRYETPAIIERWDNILANYH